MSLTYFPRSGLSHVHVVSPAHVLDYGWAESAFGHVLPHEHSNQVLDNPTNCMHCIRETPKPGSPVMKNAERAAGWIEFILIGMEAQIRLVCKDWRRGVILLCMRQHTIRGTQSIICALVYPQSVSNKFSALNHILMWQKHGKESAY